ncbi:hypothetical protein [Agromyces bauzanensis]|uniref:Uncharacterized protein n=1 Tax=Agromyces bauzanensis TaxID=1308924 RepID=A0A917PIS6_9MICO|nr:hypothetical protein [Agromyces bauzanensis]GGJ80966.1 hypothetical protein GCM10011372_19240 [Agromyces bauzanensis]
MTGADGMERVPSDEVDAEPSGRLRSTADSLRGFVRRIPFSIAFATLLVATSIVTGTIVGGASEPTTGTRAAGVATTVEAAKWWTVGTALLIPWDPFQLVFGVLATIVLLGIAERRMSTQRTTVASSSPASPGSRSARCCSGWARSRASGGRPARPST